MKTAIASLAMLVAALVASHAQAGGGCHHCGCQCELQKVCRLVCETKKTPHTTYTCKCEDFCVPCPSQKCGHKCEQDCNGCCHCEPNYVPTGAKIHTKKKLVKHVEMKEEKVHKWVVEYVCPSCAQSCSDHARAGDVEAEGEVAEVGPQPVAEEAYAEQPRSNNVLDQIFGLKVSK